MPKYWQPIAINAQEEAALYAAEAARLREAGRATAWRFYSDKAAALYARARWAMAAPDDCP
jgi:hypothetical protein